MQRSLPKISDVPVPRIFIFRPYIGTVTVRSEIILYNLRKNMVQTLLVRSTVFAFLQGNRGSWVQVPDKFLSLFHTNFF